MRIPLVALLAVAICGLAAGREVIEGKRAHSRTLAQAPATAPSPWVPADQLPECGPLLPDSLSPPPKAVVAAVFQVTGLENYTCIDGRWKVVGSRKDLYYADSGQYAGFLYAEASDPENSRLVFTDPSNTTEWGDAIKDNQATYDYEPQDPEVNRKWWRRPLIRTSGIAAGAVLVVKTDVKGGMPPGGSDCDSGDDGDLQVPMNNTYTVYACKDPVPIPRAPKCDDPDSASTEWRLAANATCIGTVLKVTAGGGSYWVDASDTSSSVFPLTRIVGEPMCDYIKKSGGSGAGCGGSATYTCLRCQ
ncbi:hypothetical protein ABPG77_009513 [Micractinium sp. CCAP 211/92]